MATLALAFVLNTVAIWALPYLITDKVTEEASKASGIPDNYFTPGVIRMAVGPDMPLDAPAKEVDSVLTQVDKVVMDCPDHLVQYCKYDISKRPLHIYAPLPVDIAPYWSISFYAHNTDNFWVINDQQVKAKGLRELNITLVKSGSSYEKEGNEEVVFSPSEIGVILIRTMIPDRYSAEGQKVTKELLSYEAVVIGRSGTTSG